MNTYVILLKLLTAPIDRYIGLFAYIKTASTWAKLSKSTWIIKTSRSASEIRDNISGKIGSRDSILVMKVSTNYWASNKISKKITDWLKTL